MEERARALLLSPDRDLAEISALASSAGLHVVREFVQRREAPHPRFHIGEGKVREIARYLSELDESARPRAAVFNGDLKPVQVFNLEKALSIPILDRIRLILEIFSRRAQSPEARLQVELARLQYDVPLVREYIHRTRTGEHPGLFFAGGAYQVDEYYEMIKKRMAKIRRELDTIRKERSQRRKTRRRGGQALLAIAGYTNAGKSALFRALTTEEAVVGPELFTTLSTATRRLGRPAPSPPRAGSPLKVQGSPVLLTDTVGFIRDLPVWLVEAFLSTLEEVFLSDAVLVMIDISDPPEEALSKLETTLNVLRRGERSLPLVAAFNKCDLLPPEEVGRRVDLILSRHGLPLSCRISAATGEGLDELVTLTLAHLQDFFFGSLRGPARVLEDLSREDGLSIAASPEGKECTARNVLLRNWRAAQLSRRFPELELIPQGAPAPSAEGGGPGPVQARDP